jgi:hypothetical protein
MEVQLLGGPKDGQIIILPGYLPELIFYSKYSTRPIVSECIEPCSILPRHECVYKKNTGKPYTYIFDGYR